MADFRKPVRVTISDPETGEQLESRILSNDYCVITAGNRYVKHTQVMGRTHIFSVAVEKPSTAHDDYSDRIPSPNQQRIAAGIPPLPEGGSL